MNDKYRGITMIGDIIIGSPKDHAVTNRYVRRARNHEYSNLDEDIVNGSLIQSCIAPTFVDGVRTILQTAGIGAVKPNVALFNMKDYTQSTSVVALKAPSKTSSPNSVKTIPETETVSSVTPQRPKSIS